MTKSLDDITVEQAYKVLSCMSEDSFEKVSDIARKCKRAVGRVSFDLQILLKMKKVEISVKGMNGQNIAAPMWRRVR